MTCHLGRPLSDLVYIMMRQSQRDLKVSCILSFVFMFAVIFTEVSSHHELVEKNQANDYPNEHDDDYQSDSYVLPPRPISKRNHDF